MMDKDNRNAAAFVLASAHKAVTVERGPQHGPAEQQFKMAGELWEVYLRNKMLREGDDVVRIDAHDVAMMMDLLKTSRVSWGDETQPDHYADKAGYTGLAAAIAGVKAPVKVAEVVTRPDGGQEAAPRIVHRHILTEKPTPPAEPAADKGKPLDLEGAALSALVSKLETPNA